MIARRVSRVWEAVRAADWWAYKIPPLLSIAYAGFLTFDLPPRRWTTALATLAAILLVAVYGYVLNDVCDIEADRASGRPNRMTRVGTGGRVAALLLPASGILAIGWWLGDTPLAVLLAVNVALPTLYSVPPVRLKGRGAWGALADACGVHAVPAALMARAVTLGAEGGGRIALFVASATGLALFTGLRGIALHQVSDLAADESAGVVTFATSHGVEPTRRLIMRLVFPVELTCLAVFLGLTLPHAWIAAIVLTIVLALELERMRRGWILPLFEPPEHSKERYLPVVNNEIYEVWLPLGLILNLAFRHPLAWGLAAVHVALFLPGLRTRLADVWKTLAPPSSGSAQRELQVIVGATTWTVNGVNVFSANLVRELLQAGVKAHVLLTEESSDLIHTRETAMPRPAGVAFKTLPVGRADGWGAHWGAMVRYLEEAAPCIYIPNSDWRHSCVCPRLSDEVVVVGVVHSDDPLHYDHVRRLGPYWNEVVAVSGAVAARSAEECPSIVNRLTTIPIGVRIPPEFPTRRAAGEVLRLVYHGVLKQHQKRVLDLPRIVEAAVALEVPIELTILGAGPDELVLKAAAAPYVDRGLIRFPGVVSPDDMAEVLRTHDVYLLASEFEGMPNALIEAMGQGCVPIVTRMTSGIPELIRDGENGFLVPIGDAEAFASCLKTLSDGRERLARMSRSAFDTVRGGRFRVEEMAGAYRALFERAWTNARTGAFVRPKGLLCPPPPQVAGVSLFPVALPYIVEGLGAFPSIDDAEDYAEQVQMRGPEQAARQARDAAARAAEATISLAGVRVFVAAPVWTANGVNLDSEELVRGLRSAGLDARLLLTEESTALVQIDEPRLARPSDIPIEELTVSGTDNWGARWGAMRRLLASAAPCIYLPNYDWRHACIAPELPDDVIVVGLVHDSDAYAEQAARLGPYCNALVTTTRQLARQLRARLPALQDRVAVIPAGANVPDSIPPKPVATVSAKVLIGGAEAADDEWIPSMVRDLTAGGHEVVLVDPQPSLAGAWQAAGARIERLLNRQQWLELCRDSHFVVISYLRHDNRRMVAEAMGHGCVPVWMGAEPPDDRLLRNGDLPILTGRSWSLACRRIKDIAADSAALLAMTARAHEIAAATEHLTQQALETYLALFRHLLAQQANGAFRRPRGPILPPPAQAGGYDIFPVALTHVTAYGAFPSEADAERFVEEAALPASKQKRTWFR